MRRIRLQKYLASCGVASRRKSEELIKDGYVKVNGVTVREMGETVSDNDIVEYNGRVVTPQNLVYMALNKPVGFLCSRGDQFGRRTIYDIVRDKNNFFSIGRLDYNSCGLIILTNDGEFANEIMHPKGEIVKIYEVKSQSRVRDELIKSFGSGILIDGIRYKASLIMRIDENNLKIGLNEGKKREIRVVYNHFNEKIVELKRVSIGKLELNKLNLKFGEYRYFTKEEIKKLIYG